jgi:hypothetical protein
MAGEGAPGRWEHAVLRVAAHAPLEPAVHAYAAIAWVDGREIYRRSLPNDMPPVASERPDICIQPWQWSQPLADLGADGWEVVTATLVDIGGGAGTGASMDFVLKRPLAG